jgi:hypothetical protein
MSKQKFFIDFDSTITHSLKSFCLTYNQIYHTHPNFKPADYTKVNQYDLKDECPIVNNPLDIFQEKAFFNNLEFINENTYKVLRELNEKYHLTIITLGTPKNIAMKTQWLEDNLSFIDNYLFITNKNCKVDKSIVNMFGDSIFLDDMSKNLISSNAQTKVLFGKKYSWNESWNEDWCVNWSEVEKRFL